MSSFFSDRRQKEFWWQCVGDLLTLCSKPILAPNLISQMEARGELSLCSSMTIRMLLFVFVFLSSFNRTCPLLYNNYDDAFIVFSSFYDDALQCCLQGGGHGAPDWRWVSNVEILYLIWNWWKLISISNSCHILIKSPLLWFHQLIFVPFWSKFDQNIPASLFSSTKLETVFKPQQLFSASCPD